MPVPWAPPMSSSSPVRRPVPMVLSSGREAERDRLVLADLSGGDLVVEVDEDVERRARPQAPVVGLEAPGRAWRRRWSVSATVVRGRERLCSRDGILPDGGSAAR